jgi:hypothetical protein
MDWRVVLMMVVMGVVLAVGSAGHLLAGSRRAARPTPSTPLAAQALEVGTTVSEQVTPEKGEPPPHPEVPPDVSKRLLEGTKIKDPKVDDNPPSPPGLPLVPGPETNVAPSPSTY